MYTETNHVAAVEPLNDLHSMSFPIEYFLAPNKSIPTVTTPQRFQSLLLLLLPHLHYLILKSIGKFVRALILKNFVRAEKVTEFLTVFFH